MEHQDVVVLIGFLLLFSLVSRRLSTTPISGPMVYVAFGVLIGPSGLGLIHLDLSDEMVKRVAEITLVLVLFADASRIDLRVLLRERGLPIRLLFVALPLTIAAGFAVGRWLYPQENWWDVALVAAILAPTDAALGQAVVSNPGVPMRIRQALNVESGLNDGLCVPIIAMFTACAVARHSGAEALISSIGWMGAAAETLGYGIAVGVVVGIGGVILTGAACRAGWMSTGWHKLSIFGGPIMMFALAETIGGSGFIAAFIGGLTVGNATHGMDKEQLFGFTEGAADLLGLFTWAFFGMLFVVPAIEQATVRAVVLAVACLTFVRMVPTALALLGMGFGRDTLAFVGWFGPRGLASIVFAITLLQNPDVLRSEAIFLVVTWAILLSIVAHGLSAVPGATWYGKRCKALADAPELAAAKSYPMHHHAERHGADS